MNMRYAKAVVAVLGAVLAAVSIGLDDSVWDYQDTVSVAIALLTAVGVYLIPNRQ